MAKEMQNDFSAKKRYDTDKFTLGQRPAISTPVPSTQPYGGFYATTAEVSGRERLYSLQRTTVFTVWSLKRKRARPLRLNRAGLCGTSDEKFTVTEDIQD